MKTSSVLVLLAVLFVGYQPAEAAYEDYTQRRPVGPSNEELKRQADEGLFNSCVFSDCEFRKPGPQRPMGQEGGGLVPDLEDLFDKIDGKRDAGINPEEFQKFNELRERCRGLARCSLSEQDKEMLRGLAEDLGLAEMYADVLGVNPQNFETLHQYSGKEGGGAEVIDDIIDDLGNPRRDRPGKEGGGRPSDRPDTVAGFCANGSCAANTGSAASWLPSYVREFYESQGYRLQNTSIIGKSDERNRDLNRSAVLRTPRVVCKDPVTGKKNAGTGVVFNQQSGVLLTAAHNLMSPFKGRTEAQVLEACWVEIRDENKNVVFSSRLKRAEVKPEFVVPANYDQLSEHEKDLAVLKSYENDWAALKLETAFPLFANAITFSPVSVHEDLAGTQILSVAYNHIPDDPRTPDKNEEYTGVTSTYGEIRNTTGGKTFMNSKNLFLHDADTNGMSSGSGLYRYNNGGKYWELIGIQLAGTAGSVDFVDYNEDRGHHNMALKFSREMQQALERLSSEREV